MKKFALLAMLLGIAAFAMGCPQGPDAPPAVDFGPEDVAPVPMEDDSGEAEQPEEPAEEEAPEEEAVTVPPLPAEEEMPEEGPAEKETTALESGPALPTVDFPTVGPTTEKAAPAEEKAPGEKEAAPAEEEAPGEKEAAPAEEKAPGEKEAAPAEEEAPAEEAAPSP